MRARGSRLAALGLLVTTAAALGRSGGGYYGSLGAGSCPEACEVAGDNPSNWTQYHDIDRLLSCNRKPKLLDFTLHTLLEDGKQNVIRACSTFRGEEVEQEVVETAIDIKNGAGVAELSSDVETTISLQMARVKATRPVIAEQIITAAKEVQVSLLNETTSSKSTVLFAHYGDSVVGVYVGGRIRNRGVALTAVQRFIDHLDKEEFAKASQTFLIQLCGKGIDADYVLGVIGDTTPGMAGLSIVQRAVKSWSEAKCVTNMGESGSFGAAKIWLADNRMPPKAFSVTANGLQTMKSGDTQVKTVTPVINNLHPRADCRTIQVVSGDSCASLATKCGISGSDLTKFNPSPTFCSTLRVGQHICCSSGTLPDLTPKPNPDGSCASYLVQSGDWCDKIATSNGLTVDDIEFFNRKTWGWSGCKRLFAGSRICLSRGDPPMPEPITNAVCGPQKPGTPEPPKGTKLADLNPCPLKACCNIWGQCGITEDFCIESSLGPPGTSEPGKNGCISNCGVDIVNNGSGPKEYMSVGYFEAFNGNRPCLHMHVEDVGTSVTHIHFSFADVNENFEVSVAAVQTQWDRFINKKFKAKRILAFGGWASSTGPTYWIFREGVKPQNRERLATNMANFIKKHDLDGIDLDWEYPGAPDIPGVPPAEPIDGPNYLELLKLIRQKLPDKSLSIAAPASYWYLKAFPIDKIADVVDYIIYMTYDLHGQWDYDNSYSSPGCPKGDCLRSHVNITETYTALSMITKAGVPSNKIVVGVSSYGRSFRMLEAGCTGPMCRFTGPTSGATRGRCTNEAGYVSNAEIDEILKKNPSAKKFSDDSGSNILVYDNLQWVAYMDDKNKDSRMQRWKGLNFAGITDWAVDLKAFQRYEPPDVPPVDKSRNWREIDCLHVAVTDTSLNSQYRWEAVRADQAWEEGLKSYRKSGTTQDFSIYMADFYDAAEGKYCSKLSEGNGCERLEKCIMTRDSGPAGTFIMNSFSYAYIVRLSALSAT